MVAYRLVYYTVIAVGIITGFYRFLKLNKSSKVLWCLLILTIITEILAVYVAKKYHNNWIVYEFYQLIKYVLIITAYLQELHSLKKWMLYSLVIIVLIATVEILFFQQKYAYIYQTIEGIFVMIWGLLFLKKLLLTDTDNPFTSYPLFWISIGYLIFEISVLFNFSAFNFISEYGKEYLPLLKNIRIAANYVLYSMYIVAFLTKQNSIKSAS